MRRAQPLMFLTGNMIPQETDRWGTDPKAFAKESFQGLSPDGVSGQVSFGELYVAGHLKRLRGSGGCSWSGLPQ